MKGAVRSADQDFSKTKSQFEQQFASLDTKVTTIEAELQRLETERASLAAGVNEDLLSRYERLFASKGDRAIVPLEHEVCMGCHMKITTQTAVRVKANREVLSCEQCGRILYHAE
jgi:predicted  nucleic acid-binding Zn-ribbon protein